MPLQRTDTGETPAPLIQLQEINENRKQSLENSLLKEALAISNEKSNELIRQQNRLIEDLQKSVTLTELTLTDTTDRAIAEMRTAATKAERLHGEIAAQVKKAVSISANELKAEIAASANEAILKTKTEMERTEKEISRQRERLRIEGGLRSFFFWTTPVLLLAQTIAIVILSL